MSSSSSLQTRTNDDRIASCLLAVLALREVKKDVGMGRVRLPLGVVNEGNSGGEGREGAVSGEDGISAMGVETPDSV